MEAHRRPFSPLQSRRCSSPRRQVPYNGFSERASLPQITRSIPLSWKVATLSFVSRTGGLSKKAELPLVGVRIQRPRGSPHFPRLGGGQSAAHSQDQGSCLAGGRRPGSVRPW